MGRLLILLVVVTAVVALVHSGSRNAAFAHHDRYLAAVAHGDLDAGPATLSERVGMLEARIVGGRSSNYPWIGLILLAAASLSVGLATRAVFPSQRTGDDAPTLPVDAGLLAAALFAAAPLHVDSVASFAGHARLGGVLLVSLLIAVLGKRHRLLPSGLIVVGSLFYFATDFQWWGSRVVDTLRWCASPTSMTLTAESAQAFGTSFLGVFSGAILWAVVAGGETRRALLVSVSLFVFAAVITATSLSSGASIVGASTAMWPGALLAVTTAAALASVLRRGTSEFIGLAMAVFLVYSSFNVATFLRAERNEDAAPAEVAFILEKLRAIDHRFERVVVLGLPSGVEAEKAVIAASSRPWSRESRSVIVGVEGRYDSMPSDLIADGPTAIVEWRAPHPYAKRPADWQLIPLLACLGTSDRVRLISPAEGDLLSTARPESLDEDIAFEFEVAADRPLSADEVLVFTAIWDGGRTPRGRDRATGRTLSPSVLEESVSPTGFRYRWRTSIRPGGGQDGVYFDDPDMDVAGGHVWWTVGISQGSSDPHDDDHDSSDGHDHHDHGGSGARSPRDVAPTRRVSFR